MAAPKDTEEEVTICNDRLTREEYLQLPWWERKSLEWGFGDVHSDEYQRNLRVVVCVMTGTWLAICVYVIVVS